LPPELIDHFTDFAALFMRFVIDLQSRCNCSTYKIYLTANF
jgi:hypothetical protein